VKIIYESVEHIFIDFLKLAQMVTEKAKISSPYQIRCIFVNALGTSYVYQDPYKFANQSDIKWTKEFLRLPGLRIESFREIKNVADFLHERLQNAFGLPEE
jgi:hypothetical protein